MLCIIDLDWIIEILLELRNVVHYFLKWVKFITGFNRVGLPVGFELYPRLQLNIEVGSPGRDRGA